MKSLKELSKENNEDTKSFVKVRQHIKNAVSYLIQTELDKDIKLDFANKDNILTSGINNVVKEVLRENNLPYVPLGQNKEFGRNETYYIMIENTCIDLFSKYWKSVIIDIDDPIYILNKNKFLDDAKPSNLLTSTDIKYVKASNNGLSVLFHGSFLDTHLTYNRFSDLFDYLAWPYVLKILKHAGYNLYHPKRLVRQSKDLRISLRNFSLKQEVLIKK